MRNFGFQSEDSSFTEEYLMKKLIQTKIQIKTGKICQEKSI